MDEGTTRGMWKLWPGTMERKRPNGGRWMLTHCCRAFYLFLPQEKRIMMATKNTKRYERSPFRLLLSGNRPIE